MDHTFNTPGHVLADVRIPSGDVIVRARDMDVSTVHIEGDRGDEDITVTCEPAPGGGHHLLVEVRNKKNWALFRFSWGQDLEVVLEVPTSTDLQVNTGSADLGIRGTVAGIDVRTASGEVRFENVDGDVKVKSASGDTQGRSVQGHLTCHGASGDVDVETVRGGVTIRTASGDLELGEVDGGLSVSTVSGDVTIGALRQGNAQVRSVSGDIEVGVAQGVGVFLDVQSASGEVACNLDAAAELAGGSADLEINASSVSGDITIRRAAVRAGSA
ncbi:MAG TPA: DUF4097 family beta strand repeat-containing protein [Actinomycetota bacterium]|nr:DUF4097 family beta strand repeat-containing protein [Actinomycetota bacterium]